MKHTWDNYTENNEEYKYWIYFHILRSRLNDYEFNTFKIIQQTTPDGDSAIDDLDKLHFYVKSLELKRDRVILEEGLKDAGLWTIANDPNEWVNQ